MVLKVINTKPYKIQFGWVEIAPIGDQEDTIRTNINAFLEQGEIQEFEVNSSNIFQESEASLQLLPGQASANGFVGLHICIMESYKVGGSENAHTVCGRGNRVKTVDEKYDAEDEDIDCRVHGACACDVMFPDCPLSCQFCFEGLCDNYQACADGHVCVWNPENPTGFCMLSGE